MLRHAREVPDRGRVAHADWLDRYEAWRQANPSRAALLDRQLPENWTGVLPSFGGAEGRGAAAPGRRPGELDLGLERTAPARRGAGGHAADHVLADGSPAGRPGARVPGSRCGVTCRPVRRTTMTIGNVR